MDKLEVILEGQKITYIVGTSIINLEKAKKQFKDFEYITTTSTYYVNGEKHEESYPIHFFK